MRIIINPTRSLLATGLCPLILMMAACDQNEDVADSKRNGSETPKSAPPPIRDKQTPPAGELRPRRIAEDGAPTDGKRTVPLISAAAADFRPHLNTGFSLGGADANTISAQLVEIEEHPESMSPEMKAKGVRTPFTLLFECQGAPPREGKYAIENAELGIGEIHLLPVRSRDGTTRHLEAIFN